MANKVLYLRGSAVAWRNTGATELFDFNGMATNSGRQGARHDFGSSPIEQEYEWRAFTQMQASGIALGDIVYVYWLSSDGTHPDNDDGTGDIDVSSVDKLRNLELLGAIEVDQAAANIEFVASGRMRTKSQYGHPVFWNTGAATSTTDATEHGFDLVPIAAEVQ